MSINRAELRELVARAVESGAGAREDYQSHGISHEKYDIAMEDAIDVITHRVLTLIEKSEVKS